MQPKANNKSAPPNADDGIEPFARDLDRDEETVEPLVSRLQDAGLDDERIEMEVELKYNHYARIAVLKLKAGRPEGKGRQAIQEECAEEQQHDDCEKQ